jgi:hypothetical protein
MAPKPRKQKTALLDFAESRVRPYVLDIPLNLSTFCSRSRGNLKKTAQYGVSALSRLPEPAGVALLLRLDQREL